MVTVGTKRLVQRAMHVDYISAACRLLSILHVRHAGPNQRHCRDEHQIQFGCYLSVNTGDTVLFRALMAMRKMDMLELDWLAEEDEEKRKEKLDKIMSLFYYCG